MLVSTVIGVVSEEKGRRREGVGVVAVERGRRRVEERRSNAMEMGRFG
jgi:hypothetical protein